jgi:hypothetical protein
MPIPKEEALMFKRFFILILAFSVLIAGCGAATRELDSGNQSFGVAPMAAPGADMAYSEESKVASSAGDGTFDVAATSAERMVIKNASLSIYVDDPTVSSDRISKMAEAMGGFVVAANLYQSRLQSGIEVPHASITVRVPAEKLADALDQIKAETTLPVINENISSEDVTSQYTDLESQLRNLEAAEEQLQNIMDGATKTDDVISVYRELTNVRGQIEVIKGQMKYYEQSAALSAISVELTATAAQQPLTVGGWQPKGVVRDAVQALIYALQGVANASIWLVLFLLPVGLVIALVFFLIFAAGRGIFRRLRKK